MMSAFVAGSAWICPPVDGLALAATGAVACGLPAAVDPAAARMATAVGALVSAPAPPALPSPAMAARNVVASEVASAFFR
ncbi:hypothetical protein FQZ97_1120950 [compost metagenome]